MTTLNSIELDCPVCRLRFVTQIVTATDAHGGKRTDFHERAAGTQPLPYLVHTCDRCGYTGAEGDFDEAEVTRELRAQVWHGLASLVREGPPAGSEKYEAAAKVAEWRGLEPRHIADLLLRAAWCCADEGDVEAERYFRRKAAWAFEEALAAWDGVAREERAVLSYLVGELWRRVGDRKLARAWLDRVPGEIVDRATQRWIADAAERQRFAPREWFQPPAAHEAASGRVQQR
jgi:uncharacterized protein